MSYRKLRLGSILWAAVSLIPAWAQDQARPTSDQKIQQLQQQIDDLQKKINASGQDAAAQRVE